MRKASVLGRSLTKACNTHDARAQLSSLANLGIQSQYRLPLTIFPPPIPSTQFHDVQRIVYPSWERFYDVTPSSSPLSVCHVNISHPNIRNLDLHASTPKPEPIAQPLFSAQVESTPNTESGPPKPDKPKWEEEQYPDIGKTIDIVSNHLPFLFIQPLPKSILSSKIELRLLPTTYPSIPPLRLGKFFYRTLFRAIRWFAPIFLHRSLRAFGKPTGIKGIGLEITCLRVTPIENGRRIEARWRTVSSPWSKSPSAPTNTAEAIPRQWSGWFYFDVNRQGLIVRHVVENVNNQRNVKEAENLKDILVRTVGNGRPVAEGFGSVDGRKGMEYYGGSVLRWMGVWLRIFPGPSPGNIIVCARTYC